MARPRIYPLPENGTLEELKQTSRVGSIETSTRCTAIQFLLTGVPRENVCQALLVTDRAIRKWIKAFNENLETNNPVKVAVVPIEKYL